MDAKTVKLSKSLHHEIKRYLINNSNGEGNITSFINDAVTEKLIRVGHSFNTKKWKEKNKT